MPGALLAANIDLVSEAAAQSIQIYLVPLGLRPHHKTVGDELLDKWPKPQRSTSQTEDAEVANRWSSTALNGQGSVKADVGGYPMVPQGTFGCREPLP
jgi:hypothetical protein